MNPTARDGGERNARHARRHRRVIDGESDQCDKDRQPESGDMRSAHVPAAQVEISEEENHQSGRKHGFRARAPDAVGVGFGSEHFAPEAEVDADIGEHRPGQRGCGGKDHRALDHEDNGEEQGQQACDANDDAFVERQAGGLVLVGLRLPEIELRQLRRLQFGDIGDGGAGVERQQEDIGVVHVLLFRGYALAGGDFGDAFRAEIGPDHA